MPRLTARFEGEFTAPVLLRADRESSDAFSRPEFDQGRLTYRAAINGFDIVMVLHPNGGGWTRLSDGTVLLGAYACSIEVSRDENEEVPAIVVSAAGARDFTPRTPYFQARAPAYGEAARECLRRFVTFLRFRLHQPFNWGAGDSPPRIIRSTTWFDPGGEELDPGFRFFESTTSGVGNREWHAVPLGAPEEEALGLALQSDLAVPLHYLILGQGRDAALEGDLRRGVMELAMSAEIAVKQSFFAPATAAGEAFEYLEDKNQVRIGVVELLREPSKRAFGESFGAYDAAAFECIEYLFRCRNKVVHRGELAFRDRAGDPRIADRDTLREWFSAVLTLFDWLEGKAGLKGVT